MSKFKSLLKRVFHSSAAEEAPNSTSFPAQIADRGCIPEFLAKGGFGSVYKVKKNGQTAAVKVIECSSDFELELAKNECAMMKAVADSPYTVTYLDSLIQPTENGHTVYILQEYLTPFEQHYSAEKMSQTDVIRIGIDVCHAIISCRNAGFYHTDIQPNNLFVAENGHFKLGDFGASKALTALDSQQPIHVTRAFVAPEVYKHRRYSEASEIYSLGMILYCLLNRGKLPFADQYPMEEAFNKRMELLPLPSLIVSNIALPNILYRACHPLPAKRYCTTEELLEQLETALELEPKNENTPAFEFTVDFGSYATNFVTQPISQGYTTPYIAPLPTQPNRAEAFAPPQMFDADSFAYTCAIQPPSQAFYTEELSFTSTPTSPQMFDADGFACTCALSFPEPTPQPKLSEVQFSAIAPETALKGDYTMVQLYMYEQDYAYVVGEAIKDIDGPAVRKDSGILNVAQHARVKVVLTSPDVDILDGENEQVWFGKYLAFDFAFELPFDFSKKQILLKAAVYIDDLPATRLLLKLKTGTAQSSIEVERNDITHVYMSYAREDQSKVAGLVQAIQTVRPEWEVFFDVYSLKCGSDWEQTLYRNLEICDTLFLCWSRSASVSPWVDKEWRYMFNSKGPDSIEPMPVEPVELCPPPKELSTKYFNNNLLYLANPFGT